jgi:uncharacterized protein (TIGR02001 family)
MWNRLRAQSAALTLIAVAEMSMGADESAMVPAASTGQAAIVPTSPWIADLDVYTNYVARGLSYSRDRYSLQGHVEYDSPIGWYSGVFLMHSVEIINKQSIEIDPYAGYLLKLNDWTIDTGAFSWLYPRGRLDGSDKRYNTLEGTLDVTYKIAGVKLWYDLLDNWGLDSSSAAPDYRLTPNGSSRGSLYVDGHVNLPLPCGFTLRLHLGHQSIRNYGELDWVDWLAGVEKTLGHHLTVGGVYTDTNANPALWVDAYGLELGKAKWTAYARWSFP